jgi:hypothetical protein
MTLTESESCIFKEKNVFLFTNKAVFPVTLRLQNSVPPIYSTALSVSTEISCGMEFQCALLKPWSILPLQVIALSIISMAIRNICPAKFRKRVFKKNAAEKMAATFKFLVFPALNGSSEKKEEEELI